MRKRLPCFLLSSPTTPSLSTHPSHQLCPHSSGRQGARHGSCEVYWCSCFHYSQRSHNAQRQQPPTLHREDRTHTATDTQTPCMGAAVGLEPAAGGALLSVGVCAASWGGVGPTFSHRSRADKWEPGQQLVPNLMADQCWNTHPIFLHKATLAPIIRALHQSCPCARAAS